MEQEENTSKTSEPENQEPKKEESKSELVTPPEPGSTTPVAPVVEKPKKKPQKLAFIIITIVIVLIAGGAAAWFFYFKDKDANNNEVPSGNNGADDVAEIEDIDPLLAKLIAPTTGETWLNPIVPIEKQGYFVADAYGYSNEDFTDYYQVGTRGDNTIIMTNGSELGPDYLRLFERTPAGQVTYIAEPSGNAIYSVDQETYDTQGLKADILVDKTVHYDSLTIPDQITLDVAENIVYKPTYPNIGSIYVAPSGYNARIETVIRQLGQNQIIKSEYSNADTQLTSIYYFLKTALSTSITLSYRPLDTDLQTYQWLSGSIVDDTLKSITRGCGNSGSSISRSDVLTDADVVTVGESSLGLTVYKITNLDNSLVLKAYQEFIDYGGSTAESANFADISIDDFINQQHALVIFKDNYDQWLVYVRETFAPATGCAKPVVYLYPVKDQMVSVKVGADVKISDPFYNTQRGWLAFAKTNGQLIVNNQTYNSLFWEGTGRGVYPAITGGTVVKQSDALKTIRWQLAQQGLNNNEITDFMAYWQDKMPNKPYIRLTWFNTAQMNELAPLYISPKPDTTIRVFLDAAGLDKPINLPAQDLKPTLRLGFTVVEWGGLANGKLF